MRKLIRIRDIALFYRSWAKYIFLLGVFSQFLFTVNAAVLNIADDIQTYSSLTDDVVNMSGVSELHITGATTPISGCTINLNSLDSFFFLENIKPSVAASSYLSQVQVSGVAAVLDTNVRVVEYADGAVIIPQSSTFQPLQVFTGENFQGNSTYLSQYTAYNTSSLGAMASSISSFILKRGYTATFAQTENGTGYSKNYVAQDCDLEIGVLPEKLNDQINFVRVFPWRWVSKKGIAGNIGSQMNIKWWYNWNLDQNSTLDKEYVAIRQTRWWPGLGQDWQSRGVCHLLGYNEPDNSIEANLSVGDAIWSWPDLLGTGLRVGSPAPTDGGRSSWLYPFMQQADAADLRVDFVAVHYYWCYDPANPSGAATQMYNFLKDVHDNTGRPIWITEWNNGANWTGCGDPTYAQQAATIGAMIDMLDSTPWIERYALYNWVEDVRRLEWDDGSLTDAGVVYRDQVSPIGYQQEVPGSGKSANATYYFDTNFRDYSGNGNNPLFYGAPKRVAGQIGNALSLDGVDDYLVLPTNMGQGSDFTFAAWVYWNGGSQWQRIFDFGNGTSQYLFLTPNSGGNTLRFGIKNGESEQIVETSALATAQWVHVAVTLDGDLATLYVNGLSVATNNAVAINPSSFNPKINYIGKSQWSADPLFSGMIDEVYVADHALSGTQIAGLMNDSLPLSPTDLTVSDTPDAINLSWVQSASANITANKIYRSSNGSAGPYSLLTTLSPTTSFSDITAVYESTYLYAVTAVDSSGRESVFSGCASIAYSEFVLSEGKPVTASSFQAGNEPENANDGDTVSTRWTAADDTFPQWWRVDLGSVQPITRAVIDWYNSTARAYQYRIEISDDDVNYTVLVDATGNTTEGTTTDTFTASARYVRVTVTGSTTGWAGFWECRIYNSPPLLSEGQPVTASSYQTGNIPANGNDGDTVLTRWTAVNDTYPQWWRVDLGSVEDITKAVIYWYGGTGRSYKYRIEISNDDVNYTSLVDQTARTETGTSTDIFTASARYVRVAVTGTSAGWAAFFECQIFGSATPPGPDTTPPAAPTALVASAGNGSVTLDWADNSESDLASYNVYRDTVSGGPYTQIATGILTSDYADNTVSNGTTYYYVVSAVDTSSNESDNSNEDSATPAAANGPPAFSSDPLNEIDANEDAAYSSTLADDASDPESDPLTFSKVSGPAWLSVASDGTLSGTPDNSDVGANVFTVGVSATGGSDTATLNITVINTNDAPTFTVDPINKPNATEDAAYSDTIAGSATDVDSGDILTYSKVSGPGWLSVATDGALSGTPATGDVGVNAFTVQVSDGNGGTDTATLNITVEAASSGPVVVFTDSFENGEWNGLWTEDSQYDWFDSTQRSVDGSYSAEVDGSATNAALTSVAINLQGQTNATVTFSWLIESGFDSGEYLAFDVSTDGGSNWTQRAILQGNVDAENTWHNESIDVTGISSGSLQIRFRCTVSRSNEDADVDVVEVSAW